MLKLNPSVIALRGGGFGKWLSHEGLGLMKRPLPPCEDTATGCHMWNTEGDFAGHRVCCGLDLGLSGLQNSTKLLSLKCLVTAAGKQ